MLRLAKRMHLLRPLMGAVPSDPIKLWGLDFPNRVGLAAGMDKEASTYAAFGSLGFGFVEVGTLTPRPQPGNDKPRLFRLIPHRAIINRMGFNNHGIESAVQRIRGSKKFNGVLGVNIGKNKLTPNETATDDYLSCLRAAWGVADYIAVNFSSPNTPGLRELQNADSAAKLLQALKEEQGRLEAETGKSVPLLMKVAPDLNDDEIRALCQVFLEGGLDGLIATNTTLERAPVEEHPYATQQGGLSGAPLTQRATQVIQLFSSGLGGKIPIIGVGGIMCPQDAVDKLQAGASLVQLYTGFIYEGPGLIHECVHAMKNCNL